MVKRNRTKEQTMPEVLTKDGFKKYDGYRKTYNQEEKLKFYFDNNKAITCTKDHMFLMEDGDFWFAKDIQEGYKLDGDFSVIKIEPIISQEFVYDLLNVEDTHSYYTNGIISHNCIYLDEFAFVPTNIQETFFSSVYPTISSGTSTKVIITSTPNGFNLFYKFWHDSEEGRNSYVRSNVHWSDVPGRTEEWRRETVRNTSEKQFKVEFESVDKSTLLNTSEGQMTIGELYDKFSENKNE